MLTVIAELGSGGAETVVDDLARHALAGGDLVDLASDGGWRADELAREGAALVRLPLRSSDPADLARSVLRLRRHVRQAPPDVVHAHNVRATLAAHLGTRWPRRRPPLVTTVHGLDAGDYPRAARVLQRCADRVVAVSDDVAERLRAAGLPDDRLVVIENAVPAPVLPAPAVARAALGLPADAPVGLCVARLEAPKRHDLLVEAWRTLPDDAVLLVAGEGSGRAALERQVAAAGLGARVRLLGERHDVPLLLAAADLLVLPSDREGLPMAVLEAMAAGVPVVASAVGGLRSLDRATLELVAPGSAEALAAALGSVLADRPGAAVRAHRAQEAVSQRYSSSAMRLAYQNLFTVQIG
nr:glycosyltransferase [Nocardioides luti]